MFAPYAGATRVTDQWVACPKRVLWLCGVLKLVQSLLRAQVVVPLDKKKVDPESITLVEVGMGCVVS